LSDAPQNFQHHMLKEIFEQPEAVQRTIESMSRRDVSVAARPSGFPSDLTKNGRMLIAASGSSRHAGIAGKVMIESLAHLPVEVAFSSELQYSQVVAGPDTLAIVITQSGQTADTLGALRAVKRQGGRVLAISNVAESAIMQEADAGIHTKAGSELAIPSTKSFSAQMAALLMLALWFAKDRMADTGDTQQRLALALPTIPQKIRSALDLSPLLETIARKYAWCQEFFFAGRGVHYAVALDGALKLKEASYLHAEAFPTGEIPHGPLALVDDTMTAIIIATHDLQDAESVQRYEKTVALLQQLKERSAKTIVIANEPIGAIGRLADDLIEVPSAPELILPLIEVVPLQLFAYYTAAAHGRDVDRPRNLTKAVISE
jgi:glutamine---fructose-6-phosphate transaminase (isomerizing)